MGLIAAGVDISDPSKLSEGDWELICSLPTNELTNEHREMIAYCSDHIENLITASDAKCEGETTVHPFFANMTEHNMDPEKLQAALCESLDALVRYLHLQNLCPETKLTILQILHRNSPRYSHIAQEQGLIAATGTDFSQPLLIPNWEDVCSSISQLSDDDKAYVKNCSANAAKLVDATNNHCPQTGSGDSFDICKQFETMVCLHAYVCATLKSVANACFMLVVVYDSVLWMLRFFGFLLLLDFYR